MPRLFTPPLRELTPETSLGFAVIEFSAAVLLVELLPWQKWLLIHALELLEDGTLRFRNVVVLVARQNGKSTLSQVLALWFMYVKGYKTILGTAQDLDTAEEVWQGAVDLIHEVDDEDQPVRPDLVALVKDVVRVNGKKALVLETGVRYKVKAANRSAGRGLSGDLILLDELREHQTWAAWGALTKTTMARPHAQVWALSNAGDITSVVLRYLRMKAHEALGDPDGIVAADRAAQEGPTEFDLDEILGRNSDLDGLTVDDLQVEVDDLFLAEWSSTPNCDRWDRAEWAQSNPSMGYTITERTIASAARTDPDLIFRTEVLCQWPDGVMDPPFPALQWTQTTNQPDVDDDGTVRLRDADRLVGDVVACIDVSYDRSRTYVGWHGVRADGVQQGEIVAARVGTEWVRGWLMEHADRIEAVTGQVRGAPVSTLIDELRNDRTFTIPIVEWGGSDLVGACGKAFDAVKAGAWRHNPQPVLDAAAAGAGKRTLGDGWVIMRRGSPVDSAPLLAWIGAGWLWNRPRKRSQPPSLPPSGVASEPSTPVRGSSSRGVSNLATVGF